MNYEYNGEINEREIFVQKSALLTEAYHYFMKNVLLNNIDREVAIKTTCGASYL